MLPPITPSPGSGGARSPASSEFEDRNRLWATVQENGCTLYHSPFTRKSRDTSWKPFRFFSLAPFSPTTMQIIQIQHFNERPKLCKTFQILGQFGFPSVQSFTRIWWCGVACGKVSAATCNSITASQRTGAYWSTDSPSFSYLSSLVLLDSDPERLKDS